MEKRHEKRRGSDLTCEIISRSLRFTGLIENLSEKGICALINPTKAVEDIPGGMTFVVKFQIPSGNTIDIQCKVKQAYKTSPSGPTNNVGMEIIYEHQEYKEFLKTLK